MKTSDVMTRAVVTIAPNATIQDAIRLMLGQRISGLPVVDAEGKLIGILTEGDLLRRAETGTEWHRPAWLNFLRGPARVADDFVRTHGRYVDELMTRVIRTVDEETPLDQVVETMEKQRIKRLPVMKDGRMVGVVSRSDLLRALATKLAETPLVARVTSTEDGGRGGAASAHLVRRAGHRRGDRCHCLPGRRHLCRG